MKSYDKCKICGNKNVSVFNKKILNKYQISYYQCSSCGFIQTEKPYWLNEAYSDAITSTDIGLINRNINYSNALEQVIYKNFNYKKRFLDYGGGYGMFTRIMRDKGFDFYHLDKYCQNLFAKHFTCDDIKPHKRKFELITAFEVMEHIYDPISLLDEIFSMTNTFIFSTVTIPETNNIKNWWYLGTEHGQHLSFYSLKSLETLAKKYKKNYFNSGELHTLTTKKYNIFDTTSTTKNSWVDKINIIKKINKLTSRTEQDYKNIKNIQIKLSL